MWYFGRKKNNSYEFSRFSTAEEVTYGFDGSNLTAIVTGASSGIGAETTRVLALRGVHVIMADTNMQNGRRVRAKILDQIPGAKVDIMELDLSSMASVRKFALDYKSLNLPLNILINNAGIFGWPFTLSQDKIEMHFATNYLGHFLLTHLLIDTMKKTVLESGEEGRIVNVSSSGHRFANFNEIQLEKVNDPVRYSRFLAYCQSKLAVILHTNELDSRLKHNGVAITVNSVHPGLVGDTNIVNKNIFFHALRWLLLRLIKFGIKDSCQGAATICYVALHPQVKGISGKYFNDCSIARPSKKAQDATLGLKLWNFSMNLINQCGEHTPHSCASLHIKKNY